MTDTKGLVQAYSFDKEIRWVSSPFNPALLAIVNRSGVPKV
jgi:hypothetical protein